MCLGSITKHKISRIIAIVVLDNDSMGLTFNNSTRSDYNAYCA